MNWTFKNSFLNIWHPSLFRRHALGFIGGGFLIASAHALPTITPPLPTIAPRPHLAGMVPGMSPQLTASTFLKQQPFFILEVPEFKTATDLLATDCIPARAWRSCQSKFSSTAPLAAAQGWVRLDYTTSSQGTNNTALARAWILMSWNEPLDDGWNAFLSKRAPPSVSGSLSRAQALRLFVTPQAPEFSTASLGAYRYQSALWHFVNASGDECELSAVAALNRQGQLLVISTEITLSSWGGFLREPFHRPPNVP